jgi:hypothetical protein
MAHRICDTKPCDGLENALGSVLVIRTLEPEQGPLALQARTPNGRFKPLSLRYCPFCGTRISRSSVDFLTA